MRPLQAAARGLDRLARWCVGWDEWLLARRPMPCVPPPCDPEPIGYVDAITEDEDGLHVTGRAKAYEAPDRGYTETPMLAEGERAWPTSWEREQVWQACELERGPSAHRWERTAVRPRQLGVGAELVIRCADCHVPRCGHSTDQDPCMLRRHHEVSDSLPDRGHLPLSVLRAAEATR